MKTDRLQTEGLVKDEAEQPTRFTPNPRGCGGRLDGKALWLTFQGDVGAG